MPTLIERLKLTNFLSFGPEGMEIELGPLNVLIGPNASGKSNLLEAFALLQAAPTDLAEGIREAGGIAELLWKGKEETKVATVDVDVAYRGLTVENGEGAVVARQAVSPELNLRYQLGLGMEGRQFQIETEVVAFRPNAYLPDGKLLYEYEGLGFAKLAPHGARQPADGLESISVNPQQSILFQSKEPRRYGADQEYGPITYLGAMFSLVRLYRDWRFGSGAPARQLQPADLPSDMLSKDAANLAHVLGAIMHHADVRQKVIQHLKDFHSDFEDVGAQVIGGFMRPFVRERGLREATPATRLSDGTLRYLALLAVLCHPEPPPLVCIEEPELGLHPDMMSTIAELLIAASERTQLIVTTHSDMLVDALSYHPESVIVCDRPFAGTELRRLDPDKLKEWLKEYSLGELWLKGELGGTRW